MFGFYIELHYYLIYNAYITDILTVSKILGVSEIKIIAFALFSKQKTKLNLTFSHTRVSFYRSLRGLGFPSQFIT